MRLARWWFYSCLCVYESVVLLFVIIIYFCNKTNDLGWFQFQFQFLFTVFFELVCLFVASLILFFLSIFRFFFVKIFNKKIHDAITVIIINNNIINMNAYLYLYVYIIWFYWARHVSLQYASSLTHIHITFLDHVSALCVSSAIKKRKPLFSRLLFTFGLWIVFRPCYIAN